MKMIRYIKDVQSGFTMTELITIMVIAGILSAMVAPRFFDRGTFDSRGFYDQTISTIRYAQKAAIAQHRYVCVSFPTNNSLTLTFGTTTACADGTLVNPSGTPYPISSSNTTYTSYPISGFNFNALGKPSISVTSVSVSGYATAIRVEAETGYVH